MLFESYIFYILNNTVKNKNKNKNLTQIIIISIFKIIIMCLAGYIAWDCNKNSNIFMRILCTLVAILFSCIYIIYYFIYRILMGNKCYDNFTSSISSSSTTKIFTNKPITSLL